MSFYHPLSSLLKVNEDVMKFVYLVSDLLCVWFLQVWRMKGRRSRAAMGMYMFMALNCNVMAEINVLFSIKYRHECGWGEIWGVGSTGRGWRGAVLAKMPEMCQFQLLRYFSLMWVILNKMSWNVYSGGIDPSAVNRLLCCSSNLSCWYLRIHTFDTWAEGLQVLHILQHMMVQNCFFTKLEVSKKWWVCWDELRNRKWR